MSFEKDINALVAMSNKYGADEEFVLAGGGNTSYKTADTLYIKGSGTSLATITVDGFVKIDRAELEKIWSAKFSEVEAEREAQVLSMMMNSRKKGEEGKRPSVETLLHDLLPQKFVLHVHPALVNGITCSVGGERIAAELFPDAVWVPSTKPGYILAALCREKLSEYERSQGKIPQIIFLENHGIFISADTTEEIDSLAKANPDTLSLEELLYSATLTADLERKAEIYTKVTELYADEYRGFNNLGVVRYEQGDVEAAGRAFDKALELNAKNAAVNYNCGVVALVKGDNAKAEECFGNAGGVGESLNHVNGVLAIRRADYKKAVELFGAAKVNNAALAKILTKDYAGARSVLEGVAKPNARTNYLLAVVAARQNDRAAVVANLKKAIEADGAWKEKAAKDVEFLAFAEDEEFAALVK